MFCTSIQSHIHLKNFAQIITIVIKQTLNYPYGNI